MNLPANKWICLLFIVSSVSGIQGEDDPKSEDYYEDYEDDTAQNSTSYKLNVPDSFQSYLEQLLMKGNATDEDKVISSKQLLGAEQVKDVSTNQQHSNQTLTSSRNNSNDVDKTIRSLENTLQTSKNVHGQRPTIYHPYRKNNISHLLNNLGKGSNVSHIEHHKHSSSHGKKNVNSLHDNVKTQELHQGTLHKESTNSTDYLGKNQLFNRNQSNQYQTNTHSNLHIPKDSVKNEVVLKSNGSSQKQILNSTEYNSLVESIHKGNLHTAQQNDATDQLNTTNSEPLTSVAGIGRTVSSPDPTPPLNIHTQLSHDVLGKETSHTNSLQNMKMVNLNNTLQQLPQGNTHKETGRISGGHNNIIQSDSDFGGLDKEIHVNNNKFDSATDFSTASTTGALSGIHKLINVQQHLNKVSTASKEELASHGVNSEKLKKTFKDIENNGSSLFATKEIKSLKSNDDLLLSSSHTNKSYISQTGKTNNTKPTEINLKETQNKVDESISTGTSSLVQSDAVQGSEAISSHNNEDRIVISQPTEIRQSNISVSTLLDGKASHGSVNTQPVKTLLIGKSEVTQPYDAGSRTKLLNSSSENDSINNKFHLINVTNRLESEEKDLNSYHIVSGLTHGTDKKGYINTTLSKADLTPMNTTKKHPIADLLDGLVQITTPYKSSIRKRKLGMKANKTVNSHSNTNKEFDKRNHMEAVVKDSSNIRFNDSGWKEIVSLKNSSDVIPKLSSFDQNSIIEKENGSSKQSLTVVSNNTGHSTLSHNILDNYGNNKDELFDKSSSEAGTLSEEERVNKGLKYGELNSEMGYENDKLLRSSSNSQHIIHNGRVKEDSKEQLTGITQSQNAYDVSSEKQQKEYTKTSDHDIGLAVQEHNIKPVIFKVKESAENNVHVNKTFGKHDTGEQNSSLLYQIKSKNLEEGSNVTFTDPHIKSEVLQNQINLHSSSTNMKQDLNSRNMTENLNVVDLVNRDHNSLALRDYISGTGKAVESTSISSDKTTLNKAERHPIEDLMASLVKITSSKKSLKRRKKKRKGNKGLLTKTQVDTDNKLAVETGTSNDNQMKFTSTSNPKTIETIESGNEQSTAHNTALLSSPMIEEGFKQPLSSYVSKYYLRKANLPSSEGTNVFHKLDVENQQDAIRLAVSSVEEANQESSLGTTNDQVKFLSEDNSNQVESVISKHGNNIKKVNNPLYGSNQNVTTNVNYYKNNAEHHLAGAEIGDILTSHSDKPLSTNPSIENIHLSATNILKTDENNKLQTLNVNQLVDGNRDQSYFDQQTTKVPEHFHFLNSNNTDSAHQNVHVAKGNGLESLIVDLYNVLNSYIKKTNRTDQTRGNITSFKKLESYAAIKERIVKLLSTLNNLIITTKKGFLSLGNTTEQVLGVETYNQQLSDRKLAQLLALQEKNKNTSSDLETFSTSNKKLYLNEKLDKSLQNVFNITAQKQNIIHNDIKQNNKLVLSDKSLNKIRSRNNQIDRSETKLSTQSAKLNTLQGKITNTGSTIVQMKPTSNRASIDVTNDEKSSTTNNNLISHLYENEDINIKKQPITKLQGRQRVEEEDLKKLITRVKHILNTSGNVQSSTNDEKEIRHDEGQDNGIRSTFATTSQNELLNVKNQIVSGRDEKPERYLQKNTNNVNSNMIELPNTNRAENNIWWSKEGVKDLSGSEKTAGLNSARYVNDFKQDRQDNSEYNSKKLSKVDQTFSKNLGLTKYEHHNQLGMSADEHARVKTDAKLKGVWKSTALGSRRSTDPLLKLKKMRYGERKNLINTNTITNAQTLDSINTSEMLDVKQNLSKPTSMISIVKNKQKDEYQNYVAQKESGNYSLTSSNIGQNLDENSRLHIVITPLDKRPNITVEVGVENKNSSIGTNPMLLNNKQTYHWGGSQFVGVGKVQPKIPDDSNHWFGSDGKVKMRSLPNNMFKLKRKVNQTGSHSSNNTKSSPITPKVSDKSVEKSSNSSEKLVDSKHAVSNKSVPVDKGTSKGVSVDVKDSSKVRNRKKVIKKEEVVEVNEKMKENIVLGKSKTVQTIKTEVSSVDYV